MTGTTPAAVPDEAVKAALMADVEWARTPPRPAVWQSIPAARVRAMLEAGIAVEAERAEKAESRAGEMEERYDRVTLRIRDLEAALGRVQALAESFATATHPTLGGTFAATIGLRFLEAIKGGTEEENRGD